jgi:hypothetical protein
LFTQQRGCPVGSEQERLVGGKFERHAFIELVPNELVQGLGILRPGRERIDDQKIDPTPEQVDRFRHEFSEGNLAGLVSRRHDLDRANHLAKVMANHNPVGPLVEPATGDERPSGCEVLRESSSGSAIAAGKPRANSLCWYEEALNDPLAAQRVDTRREVTH